MGCIAYQLNFTFKYDANLYLDVLGRTGGGCWRSDLFLQEVQNYCFNDLY